jgi:hypothetical protein
MPVWAADHSYRLRSRYRTLNQAPSHPLFWLEVGVDPALAPGALESPGMGIALSHGTVLAYREAPPATAQIQRGVGPENDGATAALAAGALRDHGLLPALGCRPVSPSRISASR